MISDQCIKIRPPGCNSSDHDHLGQVSTLGLSFLICAMGFYKNLVTIK